jgi:pimeloyl-ACP methyl ester carboxylesterase
MPKSFYILLAAAIFILASCRDENKPADTISKDNNMDTNTITAKKGRIEGPVGALYVDNNNNSMSEGIPVLFLHSFAGSSDHWKYQLEHVRTKRQAAAFDFRGHGRSDSAAGADYNVEALVKDVEAVINELGWDKVILVGHSMGSSTAIAYTRAHPEKVMGLMMVGAPGRSDPEQSKQIVAALESDKYQMVMDDYMKKLLTNAKRPTDEIVMQGVQSLSKPVTLEIVKGQFAYDPLPGIEAYRGPKLIVYTSGEKGQPNALYAQAKEVPSRLIPETSHWIQLDKPEQFNEVLDQFLESVEKPNEASLRK